MNIEQSVFKLYADELCTLGLLTQCDVTRILNGLNCRGNGFIHDLCLLANTIRLGLSTGIYSLCEHTRKVFQVIPHSVLPKFLGFALRKVFHSDGYLRSDFDQESAAQLLMFLDSLKKQSPSPVRAQQIEAGLWDGLKQRMEQVNPATVSTFVQNYQEDEDLRRFYKRFRSRFRDILSRGRLQNISFATGPGSNLDGYASVTSSDWYVDPAILQDHELIGSPVFQQVVHLMNRVPFEEDQKELLDVWDSIEFDPKPKQLTVSLPDFNMRCSAQPKSYKALRGVGVMNPLRMAYQLSLQRIFYRDCLVEQMPLRDQSRMFTHLAQWFWHVGTIDSTEATDRMVWEIMYAAANGVPLFNEMYLSRTRVLETPIGTVPCTAPIMGEGITFCLLSTFMYAIAMAVCDEMGSGHELVRIYGDDIITPHYHATISRLHQFGMKVNIIKSYPPDSHFKESCEGHFVCRPGNPLSICKPIYIPNDLSRKNKVKMFLTASEVYRLLTASKKAYRNGNSAFSSAVRKIILKRTRIRDLPTVHPDSNDFGHPSLEPSFRYLCFTTKPEETFRLSEKGHARQCLRSIGDDSPSPDAKLTSLKEYEYMTRNIKTYRIHDAMKDFEGALFRRILAWENPTQLANFERNRASNNDVKSWVISNLPEATIVFYIQYVTSLLKDVERPPIV